MYKIIGADGKEYGPIPADVIRQWIAEGRADAHTRILAEGSTEWRPLSAFPEFGAVPSANQPPPPATSFSYPRGTRPESEVSGPAIALMITAILSLLYQGVGLVMHLIGAPFMFPQQNPQVPAWVMAMSGSVGLVVGVVNILLGLLVLFAAIKMKKLENYGLAMTGAIVPMIPCISFPCCVLGLPFGIWALVVLNKPSVKDAFH